MAKISKREAIKRLEEAYTKIARVWTSGHISAKMFMQITTPIENQIQRLKK